MFNFLDVAGPVTTQERLFDPIVLIGLIVCVVILFAAIIVVMNKNKNKKK